MFRKLYPFPFSGGGRRHLLCWVHQKKLTSITGLKRTHVSHPSPEDGNIQFQKRCVQNAGRWTKSKSPVIPGVIHHLQNLLECSQFLSVVIQKDFISYLVYKIFSVASEHKNWHQCIQPEAMTRCLVYLPIISELCRLRSVEL
jgi:hypothetical protein